MAPESTKHLPIGPPVKTVLLVGGRLDIRSISFYGLNLARALREKGVEVLFLCGEGPLREEAERTGVSTEHLDSIDCAFPDFRSFSRAAGRARGAGVELVHALSPGELKIATRFGKNLGVPVVVTFHDYYDRGGALKLNRRYVRRVIAVSEAVREDIVNHLRISKDLVRVIPTGVDLSLTGTAAQAEDARRIRCVGTIGSLSAHKGYQFLIEAAGMVLDRGFRVNFLFVGEGEEKNSLKKLAEKLEIKDNVLFLEPRVTNTGIFQALDVFVMPSLKEGLGQVAIDAMGHGVPVVATGVGGLYSVVQDEQTGLIVPQRDAHALANAIVRLLDDPGFSAAISRRAREIVEKKFSMERVVHKTLELYESVTDGAGK